MTERDAPFTAERDKLARETSAARERLAEAEQAIRNEWQIGRDLLAPLWSTRHNSGKRNTAFLREQTASILREVEERNLAFDLSTVERGLVIADVDARDELANAKESHRAAALRLRNFEREHATALKGEQDAAEAASIRETLQSDDPAAIRAAVGASSA